MLTDAAEQGGDVRGGGGNVGAPAASWAADGERITGDGR
jgi:hypothetical protein